MTVVSGRDELCEVNVPVPVGINRIQYLVPVLIILAVEHFGGQGKVLFKLLLGDDAIVGGVDLVEHVDVDREIFVRRKHI